MNKKVSNINDSRIFYIANNNKQLDMIFINEYGNDRKQKIYDKKIIYDVDETSIFKQGEIIFIFLTADFTTEKLAEETFYKYFKSNLKNKLKEFNKIGELDVFQKRFRSCVDFIFDYEVYGNGYDLKFKEHMRHSDYNKSLSYLREDEEILRNMVVQEKNKNYDENYKIKVRDVLQYVNDIFILKSVPALLYVLLREYTVFRTMPIRRCKNCDRYFIVQNRKDELYCNRLYKDTNKTCKQIGSAIAYVEKLGNNPALTLYRNMTKRKHMKVKRSPEDLKLSKEFDKWKIEAKQKYNDYKSENITDEEFIKWLEFNDY